LRCARPACFPPRSSGYFARSGTHLYISSSQAEYFAEKAGLKLGGGGGGEQQPKKEKKKKEKKEGGEKKEKVVDPEVEAKIRAKKVKAIEKEGGKKGVEIEGASDMVSRILNALFHGKADDLTIHCRVASPFSAPV